MSGSCLCLMNWMVRNDNARFVVDFTHANALLACIPGAVQTADGNS
jgi:hypothetical protein